MFLKYILFITLLMSMSYAGEPSISITKSQYDYNGKFQTENDTKVTAVIPVIGRGLSILASAEDINRFGMNGKQVGVELYSKFFDKDWGYTSLYFANNTRFLPVYDFTAAYYKNISHGMELGLGVKRMSYENKNINIVKGMFDFPFFIPATTIMETISLIPEAGTRTLNSKIIYNNEKDIKAFYSFIIGNGSEDFGYRGIQKVDQEIHVAGIDYEFQQNWIAGIQYSKEFYKDLYIRTGGNISLKYSW